MKNVKNVTTAENNQPSSAVPEVTTSPIEVAKRGRGRPTLHHDNGRVQVFMSCFSSSSELREDYPLIDNSLVGVTHLQTEGQASTRPLSKRRLFDALQHCSIIDTESVAHAFGQRYSLAAVKRYCAAARVASRAILNLLDRHPQWETQAAVMREGRETIDRPYFAELRAAGLM